LIDRDSGATSGSASYLRKLRNISLRAAGMLKIRSDKEFVLYKATPHKRSRLQHILKINAFSVAT
jgi:hypothetical protein